MTRAIAVVSSLVMTFVVIIDNKQSTCCITYENMPTIIMKSDVVGGTNCVPELEAGIIKPKNIDDQTPIKPKNKRPTFLQNLGIYITEFTENTSLHGVKYLGEQKRNIFEKIWWFIVFIISLYLCIYLILKTYKKWDSSPVIVSFAERPTPVWQIPFPAVTICSETKSRQTVYNFTEYYHKEKENMTAEELKKFEDLALFCGGYLYEGNEITSFDAIEFLSTVAPEFSEMLWMCVWYNNNETCDSLFTPILTEEGICYTFNMLDRDDIYTNTVFHYKEYLKHDLDAHGWTLENRYNNYESTDTFPRRTLSAGAEGGITILMRAYEQDFDYLCRGQGFKILLHHPGEVPRVSLQYFRAALNQEVVVAIKPDMMTTAESLRDYDPQRRNCFFSNERELRFYKNYTQQNCEVECLTNFTYIACGCVAYHMPHDEDTPICGTGNKRCMVQAQRDMLASEIEKGPRLRKGDIATNNLECNCLPGCTSLVYNTETSQVDFNWRKLFQAYKANISEFPGIQVTRVQIFFKEMQFITSERNELFGLADFIANCGGLLGLFIGFSFLSVVETIYFITLRLLCNVRRHGRYFWSGSPQLLNNDAYDHAH